MGAGLHVGVGGGQLQRPARPEAAGRERELHVLVVGVEQHEERVALDAPPARVGGGDLVPVEEGAEEVAVRALPVAPRHPPAVGAKPPHVRQPGAHRLAPGQEGRAAEDGVGAAQGDQAPGEGHPPLGALIVVPVVPAELVVLAPGVVVAVLAAGELVPAQDHRDALGEH
jgi:hypothetical protein